MGLLAEGITDARGGFRKKDRGQADAAVHAVSMDWNAYGNAGGNAGGNLNFVSSSFDAQGTSSSYRVQQPSHPPGFGSNNSLTSTSFEDEPPLLEGALANRRLRATLHPSLALWEEGHPKLAALSRSTVTRAPELS